MSCAICLSASPYGERGYSAPFSGAYLRRVGVLQHLDGVERFAAGAVQHAVGGRGVLGLERRLHHVGRLSGADAELADLADRERRRGALERARQLRRQRDGAERRRPFVLARVQVAVQPAVPRALDAGRAVSM